MQVGEERIREAQTILQKYKTQKRSLEQKIIKEEEYWRKHQWAYIDAGGNEADRKCGSAWLFSCIVSKEADIMDSYPEANFVARMKDDEAEAHILSEIVPVILTGCGHKREYLKTTLYALKHGGACYGVFWDGHMHNGLGDIRIKNVDLLNLYWRGGIENIQESPHVFYTKYWDNEQLLQMYPEAKDAVRSHAVTQAEYLHDDAVDNTDRTLVVDWYYKKVVDGRMQLHYCKFCGDHVLEATENEPDKYPNGWYEHGEYPFHVFPLFPIADSLCGYGYMDIAASTQENIDILDAAMLKNTVAMARTRYFFNASAGINEDEFADWTRELIHTNGNLGDDAVRQVMMRELPSSCLQMRANWIEEMKETTANRDVSNGSTKSSLTAASAIAALQEAGGKVSRLNNSTFYDAHEAVMRQVVELIRQFYDTPRVFRIVSDGNTEYKTYVNDNLRPQSQSNQIGEQMGLRKPEFDIEITAQKQTAYTKLSHNELMIQMYQLGVFAPNNADQAKMLLHNLDVPHKDDLIGQIEEHQTLQGLMEYYKQAAVMLAMKYEPQIAQQLMQASAPAEGGAPVPAAGAVDAQPQPEEHPRVEQARAQAQESTRV